MRTDARIFAAFAAAILPWLKRAASDETFLHSLLTIPDRRSLTPKVISRMLAKGLRCNDSVS